MTVKNKVEACPTWQEIGVQDLLPRKKQSRFQTLGEWVDHGN